MHLLSERRVQSHGLRQGRCGPKSLDRRRNSREDPCYTRSSASWGYLVHRSDKQIDWVSRVANELEKEQENPCMHFWWLADELVACSWSLESWLLATWGSNLRHNKRSRAVLRNQRKSSSDRHNWRTAWSFCSRPTREFKQDKAWNRTYFTGSCIESNDPQV